MITPDDLPAGIHLLHALSDAGRIQLQRFLPVDQIGQYPVNNILVFYIFILSVHLLTVAYDVIQMTEAVKITEYLYIAESLLQILPKRLFLLFSLKIFRVIGIFPPAEMDGSDHKIIFVLFDKTHILPGGMGLHPAFKPEEQFDLILVFLFQAQQFI